MSRPRLVQAGDQAVDHLKGLRSNKEIAGALAISERTAKFHVTSILKS